MAKVSVYLNFNRTTEAAFLFYKEVFKTEFIGDIARMSDAPPQEGMPPLAEADKDLVMHVALPLLGDFVLMGTDATDSMGFKLIQGNNVYINLEPKPEYYHTPEAYLFIKILMDAMYITIINAIVFVVGLVLLWTKRAALAAVLVFPVTVNVVAFHAFMDGGLLTSGAMLGNLMFFINVYLFWYHREQYRQLLAKDV